MGLEPEDLELPIKGSTSSCLFDDLQAFIEEDLTDIERHHFMTKTIKGIADSARNLELLKPPGGLKYNLQQESSTVELSHKFACSLLANCFFSTFPNRTGSTHPTLQNFNFVSFFKALKNWSVSALLLFRYTY